MPHILVREVTDLFYTTQLVQKQPSNFIEGHIKGAVAILQSPIDGDDDTRGYFELVGEPFPQHMMAFVHQFGEIVMS